MLIYLFTPLFHSNAEQSAEQTGGGGVLQTVRKAREFPVRRKETHGVSF